MKRFLLIISVILSSCASNPFDVDVENISGDFNFIPFHQEFDTVNAQNIYADLEVFNQKYGDFAEFYLCQILALGNPETSGFVEKLDDFLNYCKANSVFTDVKKTFNDTAALKNMFTSGIKHYRYYFPEDQIPDIYTVVSGFQESVFPTDGIVALSLDKYLGANYYAYANLGIDNYKRKKMVKEMLPVDFFKTIGLLKYPKSEKNSSNLLSEMLYQGRLQYFLNAVLPDTPDSLRWGYTTVQYLWVDKYEEDIWNVLVDKKLLFITNQLEIRNFTGEGPFTNALGNHSSPGCASFCGYKIVCSYMKNNPEITLKQLMETENLMEIYNKAKYNP